MTPAPITRRGVIGAPILLAGCRKRSEYFGNNAPPPRRVLKFALGPEPDGLDPVSYNGGFELYLLDLRLFKYASIDTEWRPR